MNGEQKFYIQERLDIAELRRAINSLMDAKLSSLDEAEVRALKEDKATPIKLDDAAIDADIIMGDEK